MLQTKKGRSQRPVMRLSANGRSLLIHYRSWLAGKESLREVPLSSICDYQFGPDQKLVLYTFDHKSSVAEWKKVRKLRAIDTSDIDGTVLHLLLAKVKEVVRTNQQLGFRKQHWYYISMPINLEFG